jgi:1-acyl-sn-glycerol-3-phosphate acyltransferase
VRSLLAAGISVIFFPEGTRTRDGRLQVFKPGGFAVAVEAGVPVVPIAVKGSRAIWPPGGLDLRPGAVEVEFSDPIVIDPQLQKKAARESLMVKVREAIAARLGEEPVAVSLERAPAVVVSSSASEHPSS